HRRRSRQPRAVDPERRAALAARRRERAARGESAAARGATASARGATYRSSASVERPSGQVYGSRAAGTASVATRDDRRRRPSSRPSSRADRDETRPSESPRRRIPLWSKLTVIAGAALTL